MEKSPEGLRAFLSSPGSAEATEIEMALRCWMRAEPKSALEIVKTAQETKLPLNDIDREPRFAGPSVALFAIWAKADLPAMIRWSDSLDVRKDDLALEAQGFLMSRVDAKKRSQWLARAKSKSSEDDPAVELLERWAQWDPRSGLDAALATNQAEVIRKVVRGVTEGPWGGAVNSRHFGLGVIQKFDLTKLPKSTHYLLGTNWEQHVMEAWGEVDIGETARHGLDFILVTNYAPRDQLMRFFSGEDVYPDEGCMIDRTFCALRVWAVVKPDEMKAWIATLKDAAMRKALTWLLEHPWGTGVEEW
jgi:hypothetical protein